MTAAASSSDSGLGNLINWVIMLFRVKWLNKTGVDYFYNTILAILQCKL